MCCQLVFANQTWFFSSLFISTSSCFKDSKVSFVSSGILIISHCRWFYRQTFRVKNLTLRFSLSSNICWLLALPLFCFILFWVWTHIPYCLWGKSKAHCSVKDVDFLLVQLLILLFMGLSIVCPSHCHGWPLSKLFWPVFSTALPWLYVSDFWSFSPLDCIPTWSSNALGIMANWEGHCGMFKISRAKGDLLICRLVPGPPAHSFSGWPGSIPSRGYCIFGKLTY